MDVQEHFYRLDLAKSYVAQCMGGVPFSTAPSGLFLAAARRTGKSEFLRNDLTQVFEAQGALVIYVDLWEDGALGSQALIARAISKTLESYRGMIERAAKKEGIKKVSAFGVGLEFELGKVGTADGMTLKEALSLLHDKSGKKIALIIDEAQHALTSDEGSDAMFALKSARDQMRIKGDAKLMLVMSGSHKDKLARLVMGIGAPFYGSSVQELPTLGAAFALDRAKRLIQLKPEFLSLDKQVMQQAFTQTQERPEVFGLMIGQALENSYDLKSFEQQLSILSELTRERDRQFMAERFTALDALEQVLLVELMEKGAHFQPMAAQTLARLTQQLSTPVTVREVQTAIDNLCKQERRTEPPYIWKAGRATWDMYDQSVIEWYEYLKNAGQWPPH